jgi:hypothetical protein
VSKQQASTALDLRSLAHDLFEREPPQFAVPLRIVGGNVKRERQRAALEERIGIFDVVPIAVVEGETDEAPVVAVLQPFYRLVERDDVETRLLHLIEDRIEKFRGDFQDAIRRVSARLGRFRPDVMQGEDRADALRVGREQAAPVWYRPVIAAFIMAILILAMAALLFAPSSINLPLASYLAGLIVRAILAKRLPVTSELERSRQ